MIRSVAMLLVSSAMVLTSLIRIKAHGERRGGREFARERKSNGS